MRQNRWSIGLVSTCTLCLMLAAGCTGTDVLDNGNSTVSFEITTVGATNIPYDCVRWGFGELLIRPLDGTCGPNSVNPGEPCLNVSDCPPLPGQVASCQNSSAGELLPGNGIEVLPNPPPGDILGAGCNPTIDAGGKCAGLTPQTLCTDNSDCGFCEQDPNPPCSTDADCPGSDVCTGQADCVNVFGINGNSLIPPDPLILSAGIYEIGAIRVGAMGLYQDLPQPPLVPPGPYFRGCSQIADVTDSFGDALRFSVSERESKVIRFEVNLTELEANLPQVDECGTLTGGTGAFGNITSILECVSCDAAP